MSAKSAGRRDLLDCVIRKYRPGQYLASLAYTQLIESVRANSSLLSPRSFRTRSYDNRYCATENTVYALSRMAGFHTRMIRSAYAWRPTRASIHDLSQHLFARFEVPQFAHRAWFDEVTEIRVLLDMARGINPRKAVTNSGLAARLTRKASHLFANAPDRFGVLDTIRWAQLRSLGASIDAANRIVKACQGYRYDEAFWLDLARFLVYACNVKPNRRERSVVLPDDRELKAIARFVWQQRYVDASRVLGYRVHHDVPLQPNFSFAGRTLKSLRRHMANWRREVDIPISTPVIFAMRNRVWYPSGLQSMVFESFNATWEMVELLESKELRIEGGRMQHCVAGYTSSCVSGRSSIWSLRRKVLDSERPVVTIEVWPKSSRIVQMKAKRNAKPTVHARTLIRRWAAENGLAVPDS